MFLHISEIPQSPSGKSLLVLLLLKFPLHLLESLILADKQFKITAFVLAHSISDASSA